MRLCICRPVTAAMTVCSAHFVPSDFFWGNIELDVWQPHRRRLKKNAVPTQCLPLGTQVKKGSRQQASLQGLGNENGNTAEHVLPDGFVAGVDTASQEDKVAGVHHQYGTQESAREGLKEKIQVQINGDGGALECVLPDGNGFAADMASQEDRVAAIHHQQRTRKSARRSLKKKNIQLQINGDGGTLEFGFPRGGCAAADTASQEEKVTELRHQLRTGSTRKAVKKKSIQVRRNRGGGKSECILPDESVAAAVIASQEDNVAAVRRQLRAKQNRRKGLKKKNIQPTSRGPITAKQSGHLAERQKKLNLNRQASAVARNCHKQAASNARAAAKQILRLRSRRRVRCKTRAVQACIKDPSVGVQASLPTVQHSFVQTDHRRLLLVERVMQALVVSNPP